MLRNLVWCDGTCDCTYLQTQICLRNSVHGFVHHEYSCVTYVCRQQVQLATGEERVINVDTAISSEHARVEFEPATGQFFICDGTPTKPSTNGTWYRYGMVPSLLIICGRWSRPVWWIQSICRHKSISHHPHPPLLVSVSQPYHVPYRLSGPHQESPPHVLNAGVEVLIGTVRFVVRAIIPSASSVQCLS
jgi:hypothetical protein